MAKAQPSKHGRPTLSRSVIDLRAQASETSCTTQTRKAPRNDQHIRKSQGRAVTSLATTTSATDNNCVVCKAEKHPLYVCTKFKSLPHEEKISVLRSNGICMNCLSGGHFKQQCKSSHKCKICQRPHHTLLHIETQNSQPPRTNAQQGSQPSIVECCNEVAVQHLAND